MLPDFVEFPKIPRPIVVTEKIDGTNASVTIHEDGRVLAGSRTRWITPEADNFGFARWVREHEPELRALGVGTHYGEWWGQGIRRGYGQTRKRFSLFNVTRWAAVGSEAGPKQSFVPVCCDVVPVLGRWDTFDPFAIRAALHTLAQHGSAAAPGFMRPEGIVVFHSASGILFKATLEKDEEPKGRGR